MINTKYLFLFCFLFLLASCGDDEPETIDPGVALKADFNLDRNKVNEGEQIMFTMNSTGTASSIEWTFEGGDPATSTEENPTVTYSTFGTYNVSLRLTNSNTSEESTKSAEVAVCPGNGLLAWYPLNGDAKDYSGNDFNGSVSGAVEFQDAANESRVGYSFDSIDDNISTSNKIDENLSGGATFAAWVNVSELGNSGRFISNYNGESAGGDCKGRVGFIFTSNSDNGLRLTYATDGNDYVGRESSPNSLTINTWHHIVGTWDGTVNSSSFRLYIDGVRSDKTDFKTGFSSSCGFLESEYPFEFGRGSCSSGPCAALNGSIDEVRIYNRPLTGEEVAFLAQN